MRDQARIKKIISILEKMWMDMPDCRFGQMLINYGIVKDDMMTWTLEDDDLLKGLEEWQIKQNKQNRINKRKK